MGILRHVVGQVYPGATFARATGETKLDQALLAAEFSRRTSWTLSAVVLLLSLGAVLVGSTSVILFSLRQMRWRVLVLLATITSAVGVYCLCEAYPLMPHYAGPFLSQIRFAHGDPVLVTKLLANGTLASTVFLVAASSAVLTGIPRDAKDTRIFVLAERMRRLRLLLYLGAFLLVASTIATSILYRWPEALLGADDNSGRANIGRIAGTLSVATGVVHTLLLLGFYLPAALTLTRRAYALARRAIPNPQKTDIQKWLIERGLISSPFHVASRILIVFGPLFAGAIVPMLSRMMK